MKSRNLVVKNEHPWRKPILLGGLLLGATLGSWGVYYLGQVRAGFNSLNALTERSELHGQINDLTQTNKNLHEQVTMLERMRSVDQESYNEVRNNLKLLQEEILELREEVDFYRGIVSPSERLAGLNIQTFKLDAADEERLFHYELVMTQLLKNDRTVTGVVKIFVQGVKDGEPLNIDFRKLTPNQSVKQDFRFRYFQRVEGDIRLPEGFVPRTVSVELSPRGRKNISKSFQWLVNTP